jgi:hypothetical protein
LIEYLDKLPETLRQALRPKIGELTRTLLAEVQGREPVRTGYLRSQTVAFINEEADSIRGGVQVKRTGHASRAGAEFGALEYGAPGRRQGPVAVAGYSRASGRVAAYERRRPTIIARRFLRDSAAGIRERAIAEIRAAIAEALHQP